MVLLDDIVAEVTEWTPIGAATSKLANNALSITGDLLRDISTDRAIRSAT